MARNPRGGGGTPDPERAPGAAGTRRRSARAPGWRSESPGADRRRADGRHLDGDQRRPGRVRTADRRRGVRGLTPRTAERPRYTRPAMTHVFVAPHPDDVALSCGGLIAGLRELGQNVTILTVFSGTGAGDGGDGGSL